MRSHAGEIMAQVMRCSGRTPPASPALSPQLRTPILPASRAFNAATSSLQSARLLLAACNLLRGRGGDSLQHLYAVIAAVAHDDAALAVDQNAVGTAELSISTAIAANGSYEHNRAKV